MTGEVTIRYAREEEREALEHFGDEYRRPELSSDRRKHPESLTGSPFGPQIARLRQT